MKKIHPVHPVILSKKAFLPVLLFVSLCFFIQPVEAKGSESADLFKTGVEFYRTGEFEDAAEVFDLAASLAKTDILQSRSRYNLGNCMIRLAKQIQDNGDHYTAADYSRQATWAYRAALDLDPTFTDAAVNLEISRRISSQIEEEAKEAEKKEQQQNELLQYIREKLEEFIERQRALIDTQITGEPQQKLEIETRELTEAIAASGLHETLTLPDESTMPGPLEETFNYTLAAADAMAVPDQPTALSMLIAALGAAPEDPNNQDESNGESEDDEGDMEQSESDEDGDMYEDADPFGDFSEYEEIRGVPPPNQTEMDILTEEVRNQERRKQKKSGEYKAVEKDW